MRRTLRAYTVTGAPSSTVGEIPDRPDVLSRVVQNVDVSSLTLWIGPERPGGSTTGSGWWPGAMRLAFGDFSPVFESGSPLWFRPDSGTDPVRVSVVEEIAS